jgi:hypothetical protein
VFHAAGTCFQEFRKHFAQCRLLVECQYSQIGCEKFACSHLAIALVSPRDDGSDAQFPFAAGIAVVLVFAFAGAAGRSPARRRWLVTAALALPPALPALWLIP